MIIGLLGKAQAGKTTTANIIAVQKGGQVLSFATPLKIMVEKAGICSHNDLFVKKTWFSRNMLQLIGTDLIRNQISEEFWINKMFQQIFEIRVRNATTNIFIDDVRFPNEIDFIKRHGGSTIRIIRTSLETKDDHSSECILDDIEVDHTIWNDGTIDQLHDIISDILTLIKE